MKNYTVDDILANIGMEASVAGDPAGKTFNSAKPLAQAGPSELSWVKASLPNREEVVAKSGASILVCDRSFPLNETMLRERCFVIVEDPKLAFLRAVTALLTDKPGYGIHPSATIHPEARIDPEAYIGPQTYVGRSVIGAGTVIYGNCFIYDKVEIGKNVTIHAGTVIGADGFGYQRNKEGELEKFPHIGGVIIEDNVDIGANTCIDRGSLGNTLVQKGAKIDNLVHIAHNVVVGRHAAVIALSMIGGSSRLGDYAWIAPSAAVMNQKDVGANATVGMGAVVTKDIPEGETWAGSPARPISEFVRIQQQLKKSL